MGAPARKYELFDDDPVATPAVPVAPTRPRRTRTVPVEPPARRGAPVESPARRGGSDDPPARAVPADAPGRRAARRQSDAEPANPARSKPDDRAEPRVDPRPETPPAPVTAPRAPFVMLVLVLVAAGIIGLLVLNTKINEDSFRLQEMRDRQIALDTREQQLGSALAERQSPGNLAAAARRLGLVPARTPAFLYLPDGRVVGVAQPGGARNSGGR